MRREAMMEIEREKIPGLYSRETQGLTTMLFPFEGEDVKYYVADFFLLPFHL